MDQKHLIEMIAECKEDMNAETLLCAFATVKYKIPAIHSYVVEVKEENLRHIQALSCIKALHRNTEITMKMNQARSLIGAEKAHAAGITGKGIGIAILDTGISPIDDFTKPQQRIVVFKDMVNSRSHAYDDNGHGTHVSGIAAGNGYASNGNYAGIAPESHLISIKILDAEGQGNTAQALSGIQWLIDNKNKYNIRIANLSIGSNNGSQNIPLMRAVNAAWENGILVIAAAGNPDGRPPSAASCGISRQTITVGSYQDRNQAVPYFRNPFFISAPLSCIDIYAPGTNIISCLSPDYDFHFKNREDNKIVEDHYIKMSGTSMATPMVSGAAALLLQKDPTLRPNEIKYLLKRYATPLFYNNAYGGLLNIERLLSV